MNEAKLADLRPPQTDSHPPLPPFLSGPGEPGKTGRLPPAVASFTPHAIPLPRHEQHGPINAPSVSSHSMRTKPQGRSPTRSDSFRAESRILTGAPPENLPIDLRLNAAQRVFFTSGKREDIRQSRRDRTLPGIASAPGDQRTASPQGEIVIHPGSDGDQVRGEVSVFGPGPNYPDPRQSPPRPPLVPGCDCPRRRWPRGS